MKLIRTLKLMTFVFALSLPVTAQAQGMRQASDASFAAAQKVAPVCVGAWESPACLTAMSESNMTMVSNYGALLQSRKLDAQAETLKQHCAASTAHREQQFPAEAMKSAFIECINAISDLAEQTTIPPDVDHFQLLVAAGLCLSKDARCVPMEKALAQYK